MDALLQWEQQPGETAREYTAFLCYRNLDSTRTIMDAQREYRVKTGKIRAEDKAKINYPSDWVYKTAAKWNWKERAQAWDRQNDRAAMKQRTEEVRKSIERHAAQARALQTAAVRRFSALQNTSGEEGIPGKALKELSEVFDRAIRMERLALGIAESVVEERQKPIVKSPFETYLEEHGESLYVTADIELKEEPE